MIQGSLKRTSVCNIFWVGLKLLLYCKVSIKNIKIVPSTSPWRIVFFSNPKVAGVLWKLITKIMFLGLELSIRESSVVIYLDSIGPRVFGPLHNLPQQNVFVLKPERGILWWQAEGTLIFLRIYVVGVIRKLSKTWHWHVNPSVVTHAALVPIWGTMLTLEVERGQPFLILLRYVLVSKEYPHWLSHPNGFNWLWANWASEFWGI